MKHHLLQYDQASRLWSRPDLLPGHVFGQPEHALAFGHTDYRTPDPESGIWFQVSVYHGKYGELDAEVADIEWMSGCNGRCVPPELFQMPVYAPDLPRALASLADESRLKPSATP